MVTWGILGEGVSLLIGMQNPRGNHRIFTDPLGGGGLVSQLHPLNTPLSTNVEFFFENSSIHSFRTIRKYNQNNPQIHLSNKNQIKSNHLLGHKLTILILIKMTIQLHIYILWPGSYKIAQAVFTRAPLVQKNNDQIQTLYNVPLWST